MKMKIFSMVLVLALLASQSVLAESLFDLSLMQSAEKAISYGVSMGKEPISQQTLSDGSKQEMYVGVTDEDFLAFGTALAQEGYSTVSQNASGNLYSTVVSKGEIQLTIAYERSVGSLTVTYPATVEVETAEVKDPFEGYIVIEPNAEIKMFDTIRITAENKYTIQTLEEIKRVIDGTSYLVQDIYFDDPYVEAYNANFAIRVKVTNILTKRLESGSNTNFEIYASEELPIINFHYINEDGRYTYQGFLGQATITRKIIFDEPTQYFVPIFGDVDFQSLDTQQCYIAFAIPDAVLEDSNSNSIWAVTFEREDSDEKYVLYLDKTLPKEE